MSKWLISFSYTAVFYHKDRPTSMVGPNEKVMLIDEHPARFVTDMNEAFNDARCGKGERSGDMLHCIYSAIEVPDGTLTDDEADQLS